MNGDLIVMDNKLIRASYRLSTNELRLIYCAISKMPKNGPINHKTPYYVTKEDFIKLGVEPKNVAREIRSACSDLIKRTVIIETPIGDLETHWLHNVLHFKSETFERLKKQYPNAKNDEEFINALRLHNLLDSLPIIVNSDDNVVARIVFHEDMMPYLTDLKSHFTQYFLSDCKGFSGSYSFRIYQLMMQFKSTGYCNIPLKELRKMLYLENLYSNTADLKRRVIDSACNEINEKSPYTVKYELTKKGNKFHSLEMRFKKKNEEKGQLKCPDTIDMFEEPTDTFIKMSDSQLDTFASKLANLGEVQAMANVGEEMPTFKARLRLMLQDSEKQKILFRYLKQVGFKN